MKKQVKMWLFIVIGVVVGTFLSGFVWLSPTETTLLTYKILVSILLFLSALFFFVLLGLETNGLIVSDNLDQLVKSITASLDTVAEGVVPAHDDKTLPARIQRLVRAANEWHRQAQQLKNEKAELADAAVAAAARAQQLQVEKEELADAVNTAAADLAEMARIIWANRGAHRDPKSFTMDPKTAGERRRLVGARAFHLLGLIRPELTFSQFLEMFPGWKLPLITDIMAEAIAHHLVDGNWPLCRDIRHKIGSDAFDAIVKRASSRSEAERRRCGNQPDET
jgi:hypothetical protein